MVNRRITGFVCLVVILALVSFQSVMAKEYYKVVRADGSIEYTTSKPSANAEAAKLPGLSVISPDRSYAGDEEDPENAEDEEENLPKINYTGIAIESPEEQENLWGTEGSITVSVGLPVDLGLDHKIQINLDGIDYPALASTTFTLNDVYRGEHKLIAKVVSSSGKILATSPARTFHIMMANVVRPAPPIPTPR